MPDDRRIHPGTGSIHKRALPWYKSPPHFLENNLRRRSPVCAPVFFYFSHRTRSPPGHRDGDAVLQLNPDNPARLLINTATTRRKRYLQVSCCSGEKILIRDLCCCVYALFFFVLGLPAAY